MDREDQLQRLLRALCCIALFATASFDGLAGRRRGVYVFCSGDRYGRHIFLNVFDN